MTARRIALLCMCFGLAKSPVATVKHPRIAGLGVLIVVSLMRASRAM